MANMGNIGMGVKKEKGLVIFGAGKMAELMAYCMTEHSRKKVDAFTVEHDFLSSDSFCGKQLVPFETLRETHRPEEYEIIVAIGYADTNRARARIIDSCEKLGYLLASYVSPQAIVPKEFEPKANTIIFEGATIQPLCSLGRGVIVWSNSCICHHTVLEDAVFISPGVTVCGGVHVGARALIGAGAVVRDFLRVGEDAIVGAGSVLLRDLPAGALCNGGESQVRPNGARTIVPWPPKTKRICKALPPDK